MSMWMIMVQNRVVQQARGAKKVTRSRMYLRSVCNFLFITHYSDAEFVSSFGFRMSDLYRGNRASQGYLEYQKLRGDDEYIHGTNIWF